MGGCLSRCDRLLPEVVVVFRTLPDYVRAPAQQDSLERRLEVTRAGELSTDRAVNKDSQPGKKLPAGGESSGPRREALIQSGPSTTKELEWTVKVE